MAGLFKHFNITDKEARHRVRLVQILGLLPAGLSVMLMFSLPIGAVPSLSATLGLAVGLELILWGCYGLPFVENGPGLLGHALKKNPNHWFPRLLFIIEYIFLTELLIIIWVSLIDLGYPSSLLLHISFTALVLLLPCKALAREYLLATPTDRNETIEKLMRYLNAIFVTLFIATSMTHFILPPDQPLTGTLPNSVIFIWIPSVLIIITCIILFAEHALPLYARQSKEETDTNY